MGWQWHQLHHKQIICTRSREITMPVPHHFTGPTNSIKALKANKWSKQFDNRSHCRRTRTVQSYLPGGANMHPQLIMVLWHTRVCPANTISFCPMEVSTCIIIPKLVEIGQTNAEIWLFNGFQDYGRPPSWNFFFKFKVLLAAKVKSRDLRSFEIRFDFESNFRFGIRFVVMIRFEIFE